MLGVIQVHGLVDPVGHDALGGFGGRFDGLVHQGRFLPAETGQDMVGQVPAFRFGPHPHTDAGEPIGPQILDNTFHTVVAAGRTVFADTDGTDIQIDIVVNDQDMVGSDLIKILNNYFEKMVEVIEKHHGSVIEFLGDGIFVLFGAPKDDPDHATNAVKCAIEMQNAVVTANKWNRSHGYDELQMGVGINSGITVVGNIGSEKKMKYGCIGEAVNIAGRVESYTIGGQIYISESTKKLIREELVIEGVQSMLPKGARTEISIFDISGIGNYHIDRSNKINWLSGCRPVDITFFEVDGKHVGEDPFSGSIESLSADERFAKLMTCKNMPERSNIMIDIGGDLYAKVIEAKDDFYTICFTSKPDSFADWAETIK